MQVEIPSPWFILNFELKMKTFPVYRATSPPVMNTLPLGKGEGKRCTSWPDENSSVSYMLRKSISSLIKSALQHIHTKKKNPGCLLQMPTVRSQTRFRIRNRLARRYLHIFRASAIRTASGDFSFGSRRCMQIKLWHKQTREDEHRSSETPPRLHQQTSKAPV